jgi:hypothetical protein
MLGQYHRPSAPILTVPIPNLPVSVAEKALERLISKAFLVGQVVKMQRGIQTQPIEKFCKEEISKMFVLMYFAVQKSN